MLNWLKSLFKRDLYVITYKPWWIGSFQDPFICGPFSSFEKAEAHVSKKGFREYDIVLLETP